MILAIIKDNYVVARVMAEPGYVYPHPHDFMLEDVGECIYIGDWYEASEGIFYRPINGVPPDYPNG